MSFNISWPDQYYDKYSLIETQQQPPSSAWPDVMSYMTPTQVPVTSFLAANYGVCDQWFASVPSQTYVNRAFALTAAPGVGEQADLNNEVVSWVNDWVYLDLLNPTLYTVPSVLSQLDAVFGESESPNWKVYFHDYSITMQTVGYVAQQANKPTSPPGKNINVSTFNTTDYAPGVTPPKLTGAIPNTFLEDLSAGTLPPFSWIEPRYNLGYATFNNTDETVFSTVQYAPNSNHPGSAAYPPATDPLMSAGVTNIYPPIDVMSGELFLMQLYNALVQSPIWNETLLIITYDEHGGMYDHVPPPFAVPPGTVNLDTPPPFPSIPAAQDYYDPVANGFGYNVLGGRVPAIIVSPLIAPGSTIRDPNGAPFDHTSIIKTVWDLFNLSGSPPSPPSLTARDAAAPSLVDFLVPGSPPVNNTGPISGVLLSAPSFMVFSYDTNDSSAPIYDQILVASDGGTNPPTATPLNPPNWLTVSSSTAGNVITVTVGLDTSNVPTTAGTSTATIQIASTNGSPPATIDVTVTLVVYTPKS